ncbi:MAG: hypothetical protein ACK40G_16835 [Cytophagaceae bacterium]
MMKDLKVNSSKIEKGIIIITFLLLIVSYFVTSEMKVSTLIFLSLFGILALAGFYFLISENSVSKLLFGGFIIFTLGTILKVKNVDFHFYTLIAGVLSFLYFGAYVIVKSVKASLKYGNFEMLTFLLGLLLLFPVLFVFEIGEGRLYLFFLYGLAFVIATIMYNDNLWERFSFDEKKIQIWLLVFAGVLIGGSALPAL